MNMDPHSNHSPQDEPFWKPETGAKHDAGKPRAWVMVQDFPRAILAVSEVSTFGIAKYSAHSWLTVPDAQARYQDALMRHLLAQAAGEINDPESGLPHAAHAAWNALAVLELSFLFTK